MEISNAVQTLKPSSEYKVDISPVVKNENSSSDYTGLVFVLEASKSLLKDIKSYNARALEVNYSLGTIFDKLV